MQGKSFYPDVGKTQWADRKSWSSHIVHKYGISQDGEVCDNWSRKMQCRYSKMSYKQWNGIKWDTYKCVQCVREWSVTKYVTVQPSIYYIHKPASKLSVAATQLMFTSYINERLFYHKNIISNTMSKLRYYRLYFYDRTVTVFHILMC